MRIVYGYPPIYEEAAKVFDIRGKPVIFAWGDTIYNPGRAHIPAHLEEHEATHGRQQMRLGGPEIWWQRYLHESEFRLEQEIEAYQVQYRYFCRTVSNRGERAAFLRKIAGDMASEIYRCNISLPEAARRINS